MPDNQRSGDQGALEAQHIAERAEIESAAEAAGLSPKDYAFTDQGRAHSEDIGQRPDWSNEQGVRGGAPPDNEVFRPEDSSQAPG